MVVDGWIQSIVGNDPQRIATAKNTKEQLSGEKEILLKLVQEEKLYWEAYKRLNLIFIFFSDLLVPREYHPGHIYIPIIMPILLDWIGENHELIDEIVCGIGADGYGISASNCGLSISISFGSSTISAQPVIGSTSISSPGINQALRPAASTSSPNQRANVKNSNNPAHGAAVNNRANQMNPNSRAFRASRGSKK